jgi:hypothetical protein
MRSSLIVWLPFLCLPIVSYGQPTAKVEFKNDPANKKVEVHVGGKFFYTEQGFG